MITQSFLEDYFFNWPTEPKPPMDSYPMRKTPFDDTTPSVGRSIQIALAGFSEDQISVCAKNNILIIKGDNTDSKISHKFRSEFTRKLQLSHQLDPKNANVYFYNGLLTIDIPFKKEVLGEPKTLFGNLS